MAIPPDHTAYIAAAAEMLRPSLVHLRAQLALALPNADEVIKYHMPGFAIGGVIVAGYAAFSKQCGLYLAAEAIAAESESIKAAGLKASKTGVTFTPQKPIPDALIARLAQAAQQAHGL
ncbi:iron chaperone [Abyssibius alkaniclasticus]|uniref:iron chaperone n=1 Tax=Abyssibius alkaniclasticus TaxID=2881234 RepID=UPI004058DF02